MRFFAFWGFIKMNILIVGNGFDLSHYLPTKYDHFMVAMEAIENWDVSKGEMNFDDLFSALYEKEDYFFLIKQKRLIQNQIRQMKLKKVTIQTDATLLK